LKYKQYYTYTEIFTEHVSKSGIGGDQVRRGKKGKKDSK
jgi:hypothetical protein